MFLFPIFSIALAASTVVSCSPSHHVGKLTRCDLSKVRMPVPPNQSTLVSPSNAPEYVALGVGVQNYTCESGVWTSAGAVAALFDVSCLVGSSYFDRLPDIAYDLLPNVDECNAAHAVLHLPHVGRLKPLINHFFVPNPAVNGTGVSPRFNLAHHKSFVTTKKVAALDSPDGSENIPWLQLEEVQGNLASQVFRVNTVKGQPPGSCNAPSNKVLSVHYAAVYWFFE